MRQRVIPIILALIVGFGLGWSASWLKRDDHRGFRDHPRDPERMIHRFSERLDLTKEQESSLRGIFKEQKEKIKSLREDSRPKFDAIKEETDGKIRSLLTPEQQKKFDEWQKRREEKHRKRRMEREGESPPSELR